MKSSKGGGRANKKKKNSDVSDHILTLHKRLYQALNLGIKCQEGKGKKWQCTDIEIQRLAIRSISAFICCISPDTIQSSLFKNSLGDMLMSLEGILQSRNEAVLEMTANVTVKLVDMLGSSVLPYNISELVHSFSRLLSFHQQSINVSSATALDRILSKLTPRSHKNYCEIWDILKEGKAIDRIVYGIQYFITGSNKPVEYFQGMTSLLNTILLRWPSSRYPVWNNAKLMEDLRNLCIKLDYPVQVTVLQLYSALALCGNGAMKLLENGEALLSMILQCMGSSQPLSLRVEAIRLLQGLARSEQGFLTMTRLCCEPVVEAIINSMGGYTSCCRKFGADQVPLLVQACHFALVTRWAGEHHIYFWKHGVDRVLLDLLLPNFWKGGQYEFLSWKELIARAREGLDANYLTILRPYIWCILGWLTTNCGEHFNPDTYGNKHYLDVLISCVCMILLDSIRRGRQIFQNDVSYASQLKPASEAVLLMIYSPSKYVASQARQILSEVLMQNVETMEEIFDTLRTSTTARDKFDVVDLQTVINLIGLACLLGLPKYQSYFINRWDVTKTLTTLIGWCSDDDVRVEKPGIDLDLNSRSGYTCCWLDTKDWEGRDILLFFNLWVMAELIRLFKNHGSLELGGFDAQNLVLKLREICGSNYSPGARCYAAYIMSYFGFYGFPSRLGDRIRKALYGKDYADVQLKLSSGEIVEVHSVILTVRCPSMFPSNEKICYGSAGGQDTDQLCTKFKREVRVSSRVNCQTLMKLLEFGYTGFVEVDGDLVKQLKIIAKGCNFHSLSHMLGKKHPKWGSTIPSCDFTLALGPAGHNFSDVILEAKAGEVLDWTCNVCSRSIPHKHAHKIILWLSCDFMRALFQSGMQESLSQIIKVPVGWEALNKLLIWFYSDKLPKPGSGCIWDSMNLDQQLHEVHPYIEICWLAEFWFLEDIREDALRVVVSCINSSKYLPLKIIQIAADLSQWDIANVAVNNMAPLYPHLRDSGTLASLSEDTVDMIRVAYVRLSQANH